VGHEVALAVAAEDHALRGAQVPQADKGDGAGDERGEGERDGAEGDDAGGRRQVVHGRGG